MIAEKKQGRKLLSIGSEQMTKAEAERRCQVELDDSFRQCQPMTKQWWNDLLIQSQEPFHNWLRTCVITQRVKEYRAEPRDRGRGPVAVLTDTTRIPFSYRNAITPKSTETRLKQLFRGVIEPDIEAYRTMWLRRHGRQTFICPIEGKEFSIIGAHVDHVEPQFEDIYQEFKRRNLSGLDMAEIVFGYPIKPGVYEIEKPFDGLSEEFRRYHAAATLIHRVDTPHLRLTSKDGNLSRGYKRAF